MKANRQTLSFASAAALSLLLAACVAPAPAPVAAPPARPSPPPPPPAAIDWHDEPVTPGEWQWRREGNLSIARFASPQASALFSLACNPLAGTIMLSRGGGEAGGVATLAILTTSLSRTLVIRSDAGAAASLPARDPLLDAMAFSRGRFAVEVPGMTTLYLPSWPEVARVIEDCRQPAGPGN